jgi:long-chain fatty acid transport protein
MWSTLDKVDKTIKNLPGTGDLVTEERLNFRNILILRAGAEYVLPGGLSLRAGFGLDKSASPDQTLSFTNIDVDKFTLIGGIGYKVGKTQFDFVYVSAMGKEREKVIPTSGFPLIEKYNLDATILGLGVTFSF